MTHRTQIFWHCIPVFLLLFFGLAGHAQQADDWQQWADLLRQYDADSKAGRWDNAARQAEQIQTLVQRRFAERLAFLGTVWLAQARNGQGRFEEALTLYQASLKKTENFQPQNKDERNLYITCVGESLRGEAVSLERLGRPQDAIQSVTKAVKWLEQHNMVQEAAETRLVLGRDYQALGDHRRAIEHFRLAVAVIEPVAAREQTPGVANFVLANGLSYWSNSLIDTDRFDQAEPKLRRALPLMAMSLGWETPKVGEVLNNLGRVHNAQGRWQESEAYYREALRIWEATQGPQHVATGTGLMNLASAITHRGRQAEAETMLRRAVEIFQKRLGDKHGDTIYAISELASTLSTQDETKQQEARQLLTKVLTFYEEHRGPLHQDVAETQLRLAILSFVEKDPRTALTLLEKIEQIHRQQPVSAHLAQRVHSLRASSLWQVGEQERAIAEAENSLNQAEILRAYASGAERERAASFEKFGVDYEELIGWLAERKEIGKLFTVFEKQKARSFLDELRLKGVDLLAGLPAAERQQLTERENELRSLLLEAESQFNALPSGAGEQRQQRGQAVLVAREKLYQHLTAARAASPVYRELLTAKAEFASLAEVQQQLAADELLISYFVGSARSWLLIIRRETAEVVRLEVSAEAAKTLGIPEGALTAAALNRVLLDDKAGALMSKLSRPAKVGDAKPTAQLAALWHTLLPAAERKALTSGQIKLLTVLPAGPLALLPLETLVVARAADDDPEYLLDAGPPLAYAPSASVLLNLAKREKKTGPGKFLTLGDPAYPPATSSGPDAIDRHLGIARAGVSFRAGLARLPYTALESNWVQQLLEQMGLVGNKLSGADATEAALRRNAPGNEIVHLACHGMADQSYGNFFGSLAIAPGKPGDSRDDGFLTMAEIYELDLAGCELAIVSACETNFGPHQQGEGVWALSRGFLVAGSRRVVASNWVVDDRAGATLVSYFAHGLAKAGKDPSAREYARALQSAKRNVRKEEKWSNPFYWSSLVLVGPK